MKHVLISSLTVASLVLTACTGGDIETNDTPGAVSASFDITNAYVSPPTKRRDVATGFFTVTNNGDDDRLILASSPIAQSVEIHTHFTSDGVMAMRQVDGVDLPAGETIEFKPGSYHLMMFGVDLAENATDAFVTLTYASGYEMTLSVPIQPRG